MSGVPERLRNLSEREFYNTAIELRVEVLGIITSSAIPKSQRFTFAVPMAVTARSVVYNIVKSEAFYPNTAENVAARKRYLTLAVEFMRLQIEANGRIGLGLGSEPSQVIAVALPTPVDRLGEWWPGIEASGRYMDDSYYIARDKETLRAFLDAASRLCASLGITINDRKTHIVKLSRGFCFLKKRFRFSGTGRIVVTPIPSSISRARRRMRAHARMVADGRMTLE